MERNIDIYASKLGDEKIGMDASMRIHSGCRRWMVANAIRIRCQSQGQRRSRITRQHRAVMFWRELPALPSEAMAGFQDDPEG